MGRVIAYDIRLALAKAVLFAHRPTEPLCMWAAQTVVRDKWNLRNRRAAADYYAHESAANQPDRYYAGCAHCDAAKETA